MSADSDFQPAGEPELDEFGIPVPPSRTAPWPPILAAGLICAGISIRQLVVTWNVARLPLLATCACGLIGVLPGVYLKIAEARRWKISSGRAIRIIINLIAFAAFASGFMMLMGSFGSAIHCDSGCFAGG